MGKLTEYTDDIGRTELISVFMAHMKRQACTFMLPETNATAEQKAWAIRANFSFAENRAPWYATKTLESLVATSAEFRALLDAKRADPRTPDPTDAQFVGLLAPWIAVFVANNI